MSLLAENNLETHVINEIRKIIRRKWANIEKTTKYGWITAYFHSRNITIPNSEIIKNLSKKIGEENSELALKKIEELSKVVKNPIDIPRIAEQVFDQFYINYLIRANSRKSKLKWRIYPETQDIYTISDKLKKSKIGLVIN
ncbi:uncharacterized protein LOC141533698 [Cotesia typhae]|uniref:uncharacterized protein LOC141533698 n=1 Tax=Cotesia typhae TaxID=2053667 RepID=UPI003D68D74E